MNTAAWFEMTPDYGVMEFDEDVTAPGPALELHVVRSPRLGMLAWWSTEGGETLAFVLVGEA